MQLNSAELACEEARAEVVKWKEQFHNLEKSIQAKQEAAIVTAKVANVLAAAAERSGKVEQEKNNSSKDDVITELREKQSLVKWKRKIFCQVLVSARQTEKSWATVSVINWCHDEEVKATKHVAHVKDLGRISVRDHIGKR